MWVLVSPWPTLCVWVCVCVCVVWAMVNQQLHSYYDKNQCLDGYQKSHQTPVGGLPAFLPETNKADVCPCNVGTGSAILGGNWQPHVICQCWSGIYLWIYHLVLVACTIENFPKPFHTSPGPGIGYYAGVSWVMETGVKLVQGRYSLRSYEPGRVLLPSMVTSVWPRFLPECF